MGLLHILRRGPMSTDGQVRTLMKQPHNGRPLTPSVSMSANPPSTPMPMRSASGAASQRLLWLADHTELDHQTGCSRSTSSTFTAARTVALSVAATEALSDPRWTCRVARSIGKEAENHLANTVVLPLNVRVDIFPAA